jgi:predicted permease|tara:strand:- start:854 stop:1822 length:969 start_codon:yes stop_codon:yes gene_type:complete
MNSLNQTQLLLALIPVFALIALGWWAACMGWLHVSSIADMSKVVFYLFMPPLLFRTMSQTHLEQLDLVPIAAYFSATLAVLAAVLWWRGVGVASVTWGLGAVFSNTVMVGIPLVGLAFGPEGLVTLLTVVAVHAMTLLTVGTVVAELSLHPNQSQTGTYLQSTAGLMRAVLKALKQAVIHPVPIPIFCGLLFAQTGWAMPEVVGQPLQVLASAFSPVALIMLGATTFYQGGKSQMVQVLPMLAIKLVVLPVVVGLSAWLFGMPPVASAVLVMCAALPSGANVFMFSQRYGHNQDVVATGVTLSTALCVVSLPMAMSVLAWLV